MKALQFTIPVTPGKTVIVQEDKIPQFYPYLHRHKEAQLIWVLKGKGTVIVDNSMHLFHSNDIFLIAPNQSHVFKGELSPASVEKGIHSLSIFFDPAGSLFNLLQLPELQQLDTFFKEYKGGFKVPASFQKEIAAKMLRIQESSNADLILSFLSLLQSFPRMTPRPPQLAQSSGDFITEGEGLRMAKIYNYLTKHYQREISLDDIAAEACLTPQAFCRYFKKHTGVTFITFLNQMRVNEARKKLINGNFDSISTIAYYCGFKSITNFNRVFKSISGDSPKDYLAKYLQNIAG